MSPEHILLARQDRVLTITLNRPEKLNAVINEMLQELRDAVMEGEADPDTRCIVITGAGRAFSSGADLTHFKKFIEETKRTGSLVESINQELLNRFTIEIGGMSTPMIAAVNGAAVGFGFTLAINCDVRIASESARMGAIFLRVGLTPEFGSTYNLTRLVGIARANELVFTAKIIEAQEAKEIGLVNQVVPQGELMPATMEMARTIAEFSPIAMGYAKRNLRKGMDGSLAAQSYEEIMANRICRVTSDYEEGVTAFLEKRQPEFRGR